MATAKRTGHLAIGLTLVGSAVAGLALSIALPAGTRSPAGAKTYAIAISGRSGLHMIKQAKRQPDAATSSSGQDRRLVCRHVTRAAGLQLGIRCIGDANTIADASQ